MPAQNSQTEISQTDLIHTYREVKQEEIFIDNQDYQVFVDFLRDYFRDINKIENPKKTFTIRGNTYQGIAYQTQNFFNQIELIAYKLEPHRFDLILKEIVPGLTEKFIRAISTRYVLYFNKKHNRNGSLFRNPYNLQKISNPQDLTRLMLYLHSNFSQKDGVPSHYYSSYPEYLGQRVTEWINLQQTSTEDKLKNEKAIAQENIPKAVSNPSHTKTKPKPRILDMILAVSILFFFSSYSLFNITKTTIKNRGLFTPSATVHPQVSGIKDIKSDPSPTPDNSINIDVLNADNSEQNLVKTIVIKTGDGTKTAELRKLPAIESEVIGTAKNGEQFELISIHPLWYEIKLDENRSAFVSENYSEIVEKED